MSTKQTVPLAEQVVLVTGGGRGLGAHLVRAFAREGARVVVNYRSSADGARELVSQNPERLIAHRADVRDAEQVQAMTDAAEERFGQPVTTVVNSALMDFRFDGDARPHVPELTAERLDQQFAGVRAAVNTIQAALPAMRSAGFGRVINIGTNLFQNPVVPYHDYTAAKAALLSITRTFAAELGRDGITVNMASGGLLRTTDASAATPDGVFNLIASTTPLRRSVTPEEFADAAMFFATPLARAVTGQNLVVDGGLVMN